MFDQRPRMLGTDRFQPASRPAENGFVGRAKWLRRPWPKKSVNTLVMELLGWASDGAF
jgi:hypothetical protein